MDARLALGAVLAVPAFYALLRGLTEALGPLAGWGVGLVAYWAALAAVVWGTGDRWAVEQSLAARGPGRLLAVALALPVVVLGAGALRTLNVVALPTHLILAAAIAAVATAFLEELFWRGALVPRPSARAFAGALALYWLFHLAWLGARGVGTGLSPLVALLGPLALGGLWTAARLGSGTLGASVMSHAGTKLFLFVQVIALGQPPA